jgi:hypothetical protein
MVVKQGAPKPDISTPDAFKQALLNRKASHIPIRPMEARAAFISPSCWSAWGSRTR